MGFTKATSGEWWERLDRVSNNFVSNIYAKCSERACDSQIYSPPLIQQQLEKGFLDLNQIQIEEIIEKYDVFYVVLPNRLDYMAEKWNLKQVLKAPDGVYKLK